MTIIWKKSMENASLVWLQGSATCSDLYSLLSPVMIHWFVILELLKCQHNSCFNSSKKSNLPALAFQRLGTNVSEINFSPQKCSSSFIKNQQLHSVHFSGRFPYYLYILHSHVILDDQNDINVVTNRLQWHLPSYSLMSVHTHTMLINIWNSY